jgi:DNA-binding MarR family transcriptional regulator
MTAHVPASATADRLHSAAIRLLRMLRREDDESGLSAPRLSALSVIVFSPGIALGELAAAEQVRPPTMTRIVDALVTRGLVLREADPHDRRAVRLSATEEGRALLLAGKARRVEALTRRLHTLSAADRAALEKAAQLIETLTAG